MIPHPLLLPLLLPPLLAAETLLPVPPLPLHSLFIWPLLSLWPLLVFWPLLLELVGRLLRPPLPDLHLHLNLPHPLLPMIASSSCTGASSRTVCYCPFPFALQYHGKLHHKAHEGTPALQLPVHQLDGHVHDRLDTFYSIPLADTGKL